MNTIHRPTCTIKGSASQAWMLWVFPLSKGNEVDQMIGFFSGLTSTYRTGVRTAIDWIFIRVQNSRS